MKVENHCDSIFLKIAVRKILVTDNIKNPILVIIGSENYG